MIDNIYVNRASMTTYYEHNLYYNPVHNICKYDARGVIHIRKNYYWLNTKYYLLVVIN